MSTSTTILIGLATAVAASGCSELELSHAQARDGLTTAGEVLADAVVSGPEGSDLLTYRGRCSGAGEVTVTFDGDLGWTSASAAITTDYDGCVVVLGAADEGGVESLIGIDGDFVVDLEADLGGSIRGGVDGFLRFSAAFDGPCEIDVGLSANLFDTDAAYHGSLCGYEDPELAGALLVPLVEVFREFLPLPAR